MKGWLKGLIGILVLGGLLVLIKFGFVFGCRQISDYQQLTSCSNKIIEHQSDLRKVAKLTGSSQLKEGTELLGLAEEFWPYRDYLLGKERPVNYLVLLQNDNEIRANGGFAGSYAVVTVDRGKVSFTFQDIYVPDGQLEGHVTPPDPIQQAFKSGQWRLRDSDWSSDFSVAAKQIRWFFNKGAEERTDNLVTLPLSVIKQVLEITGTISVEDYEQEVTRDNLTLWLQNESEVGFFPGSTQKRDAINAAGKAVWEKINGLPVSKKLQIATLIVDHLEKGNMVINSENQAVQQKLEAKDWAGKLTDKSWPEDTRWVNDSYLLVESNLGANKANCCVERQTSHWIMSETDKVQHRVRVEFDNQSVKRSPEPPYFYGGNYIVYLRYYIPRQATNIKVQAAPSTIKRKEGYPPLLSLQETDNFKIEEEHGFKKIDFFHSTAADSESWVEIEYQLYRNQADQYRLQILKQHGLIKSPQIIRWESRIEETQLKDDYQLKGEL